MYVRRPRWFYRFARGWPAEAKRHFINVAELFHVYRETVCREWGRPRSSSSVVLTLRVRPRRDRTREAARGGEWRESGESLPQKRCRG